MESRAGTTNRKHPRVLSTNKSTSGGKEWRRRTTTVPRSSSCRRRACRRCSDHAPPHRTVAPTLPSEQDPLPPRRGNLCSAVVALGADASRREGIHFCIVSLSSNAKWIPRMHPLLEADAYCYSACQDAFLPLRSRMRPLLEIALPGCCVVYFAHWARFAAGPATEASEKKGLGWGAREASAANQRLRFGRLRLVGTVGVLSSQPFLSFPLWLCRSKIQAPLISDLRRRE